MARESPISGLLTRNATWPVRICLRVQMVYCWRWKQSTCVRTARKSRVSAGGAVVFELSGQVEWFSQKPWLVTTSSRRGWAPLTGEFSADIFLREKEWGC